MLIWRPTARTLSQGAVGGGTFGAVSPDMTPRRLVAFVRERGLAVVATRGPDGPPQAALVGIAITDEGELVFDTLTTSRKCANLTASPRVAVVIGLADEETVQVEGIADVPAGHDHDRCLRAYFAQYPDGPARAADPDITHVRVTIQWLRYSDYRSGTASITEWRAGRLQA